MKESLKLTAGQRVFVLTAEADGRRRIMFATAVDAVFVPKRGGVFAVTTDGQKFAYVDDEWQLSDGGRDLYLLPATDETIESVRAAMREQRRFRHQLREEAKSNAARIGQTRRLLNELQHSLDQHRKTAELAKRKVDSLRRDVANAERDLAHYEDRRDKFTPTIQRQIAEKTAEMEALLRQGEQPDGGDEKP